MKQNYALSAMECEIYLNNLKEGRKGRSYM